jgi:hypothetical protein
VILNFHTVALLTFEKLVKLNSMANNLFTHS